jgi:hypothetical protein
MKVKQSVLTAIAVCLCIVYSYGQPLVASLASKVLPSKLIQVDSVKAANIAFGFELVKFSEMTMLSKYEKPIVAPLRQGSLYRIVFIGEETSKLFEIRMYDWQEKRVVFERQRLKDDNANILSFDYIPKFSEHHMIKPVQVNKHKKEVTGYMLLFRKIM